MSPTRVGGSCRSPANDYLGLSTDPRVKAAAAAAIAVHGVGAGASRLVTGNHPLYAALEARLAAMKGTEAACVFGSGYLANIGVLGALAGPDDFIVIDELAHACLNAGASLSRATIASFRHNDAGHADAILLELRGRHRNALLVTETVFSMDGDRAPLADLADIAIRHDTWLMSDDAHGFGVVEPARATAPLQMGTLSKAVGGYGGYCCASASVVALLKTRARSLIYTTALPPATVAAALSALDIIDADPGPRRSAAPQGAPVHRAARPSSRPNPDRRADPRHAGGGACRVGGLGRRGLPRHRDPAADRADRHRPPALRIRRDARRCRRRTARGDAAWPARRRGNAVARARAVPGLFITATGTDIGKTYVTAGLLRAGRRAGIAVDALKPVLSGYDPADAETSDAGVLLAALDRPITAATIAAMSPWRFAAPLSPDRAAEREGTGHRHGRRDDRLPRGDHGQRADADRGRRRCHGAARQGKHDSRSDSGARPARLARHRQLSRRDQPWVDRADGPGIARHRTRHR